MDFLSSWLGNKDQSKSEESGRNQKLSNSQKNNLEKRTKNLSEKRDKEPKSELKSELKLEQCSATMEILTEVVTLDVTNSNTTSSNDTNLNITSSNKTDRNSKRKVSWSDDWSDTDSDPNSDPNSDNQENNQDSDEEISVPEPFFIPLPPPLPLPYSFPVKPARDRLDDMERGDFVIDFGLEKPLIWQSNPFHDNNLDNELSSSEEYILPPVKKFSKNSPIHQAELPIFQGCNNIDLPIYHDNFHHNSCNETNLVTDLVTDSITNPTPNLGDFTNIRFDELSNHWSSWSQLKEPLLSATDGEINFPNKFNFPEEIRTCEEYGQLINSINDPWILPQAAVIPDLEEDHYSEDDSDDSNESNHSEESDYSENYDWDKQTEGSLKLYIGPMFSGKSTAIIFELARMADIGFDTLYINHADDNRETEAQDSVVSTHNSQYTNLSKKINSMKVSELSNIDIRDYEYIAVDEGQFFPDLYKCVVTWVTVYGKNVLVASLDGDAFRRKFGQVLDLVPHADKVKKLTAMCNVCLTNEKKARPAPFTARFSKGTDAKVVGGTDKYKAVCRSCHDKHLDSQL